ncbi:MAG TPA: hypothetical protein VGI17_07045 [Solirubrobacterales bacterium]|jgi:hypothetical protein
MERSRPRRPSPALVISCLALFVALGGTVLAATKIDGRTIRVKSLPGNRLEVGSVPGNRLEKGTIPGSRIAPRSLKGNQIDVETLGQVPSAAHADSADSARHAQTATAADHAADATTVNGHSVGCGSGKREFAGACWDLRVSMNVVTAVEAEVACAAGGGEVPRLLPLLAFVRQPGILLAHGGEWTGEVELLGGTLYEVGVLADTGTVNYALPSELHPYRCVTPLLD